MSTLIKRVAFVIDASGGIGAGRATQLSENGGDVPITCSTEWKDADPGRQALYSHLPRRLQVSRDCLR